MKNKHTTAVAALAMVFILSGFAVTLSYAQNDHTNSQIQAQKTAQQQKHHKKHKRHHRKNRRHAAPMALLHMKGLLHNKKLHLSDSQKTQIKKILKDSRQELRKDSAAVRKARVELSKQVQAKKLDKKSIENAANQLGKAIGQRAVTMAIVTHQLRKTLTAQQLEQIENYRKDVRQHRHQQRKNWKAKHHHKSKAHHHKNQNNSDDEPDNQ